MSFILKQRRDMTNTMDNDEKTSSNNEDIYERG